jgi:hypothetical protein
MKAPRRGTIRPMQLPASTIPELKYDCARAFAALVEKRKEIMLAIDSNAPWSELRNLQAELEGLSATWNAAIHRLLTAVERG